MPHVKVVRMSGMLHPIQAGWNSGQKPIDDSPCFRSRHGSLVSPADHQVQKVIFTLKLVAPLTNLASEFVGLKPNIEEGVVAQRLGRSVPFWKDDALTTSDEIEDSDQNLSS